jgi:hypothetical protein
LKFFTKSKELYTKRRRPVIDRIYQATKYTSSENRTAFSYLTKTPAGGKGFFERQAI